MPAFALEQLNAGQKELDTNALKAIIDEMAQLGIKALALTGGEPLLHPDFFELVGHANQKGLMVHLSTNGLLIDSKMALKLVLAGIESIGISIDGSNAATHEHSRLSPGSFSKAIEALQLLVEQRNRHRSQTRIKVLSVVDSYNIKDIPTLIKLTGSYGADGIELMPRQQVFANASNCEVTYPNDVLEEVDRLAEMIMSERKLRKMVDNSDSHLKLFRNSFAGNEYPWTCHCANASLAVDCYGAMFPCHPWANWRRMPVSILDSSLVIKWNSLEYENVRANANHCRRCHMNCMSELSIMLEKIPAPPKINKQYLNKFFGYSYIRKVKGTITNLSRGANVD
jgi:MoaA/NifB/PqqE/SkfB family radical SAM enzyme